MDRLTRSKQTALGAALALVFAGQAGAQCLTTPGTTVGNPTFGATVQTFINLGITPGAAPGIPGTACIEDGLWTDPAGFVFGTYVGGAEGAGFGFNPAVLGQYNGATLGSVGANANARDFYWVQDVGGPGSYGGVAGNSPSNGIIWDLGGQANQLAVFVFVDHLPVPGEVLENTAWLSNNPAAPDAGWTQATLTHVYGAGWSPDPNVADGFVAVYQLPGGATFRYASVTWGGPGAIHRDGDNEIDAVGGLTVSGGGVGSTVPEPVTSTLVGLGVVAIGFVRHRRRHA